MSTTIIKVAKGSTFKRCNCTDTATGKELGKDCAKLYRGRGWNDDHGTWQYQIELPKTAEGKRRPLRKGPWPTQDVAEAVLTQIRAALLSADDKTEMIRIGDLIWIAALASDPIPTPEQLRELLRTDHRPDKIPDADVWFDRWLAKRKVKKNTIRSYEAHLRLHIKPVVYGVRIDKVGTKHAQDVFDRIEERNQLIAECRGSRDQKKRDRIKGLKFIGPSTMHRIRATARAGWNAARRLQKETGVTGDNPFSLIELPPAKPPKPLVWTDERVRHWERTGTVPSRVMVWTPQQTGGFLDHVEAADDRLYALYQLVAFTGLRRGEACGLHWTDVDLDNKIITIRWQIAQLGWATELETPKTDDSVDTVTIDDETITALRAHRLRQWRERAAAGQNWAETGLVFTTPTGGQLHPADVTDHFKFLTRQAGLPPIRFHDLRHGAAALGIAAGLDMKVISGRLRHSSITITMDIYGSILPELAHEAAEKTAAVVPRRGRTQVLTTPDRLE